MVTYEYLLRKFYGRYKWQWCKDRGCKPEDVDEEIGINGECFVCMEEFEDNEFQDEEYMKSLLCEEEYSWWRIKDSLELKETEEDSGDDNGIYLCTFPDSDDDYCKGFVVEKEWLVDVLGRMDGFHNREGVDLKRFLDNYVWDETWFIYLKAKKEECVIMEEEVHCK